MRRTLPVAVAFAVSAALLLTACGEGDEAKGNDGIAGAGKGAGASASASQEAAVDRPEIALPSDLKDTFESWNATDATQDSVLKDVAQRIDATNYAITKGHPEVAALSFYYKDSALGEAQDWVQSIVGDGYTITGENRYYNAKVDVFDDTSARDPREGAPA
ncbi:hypothetical protein [Streptomyces sp. NPDC058739]|uniref:hypothetical protein n=1 Tax=Streptomyces sp. NPDC058739 TaxID=3346618 RepID=UPI003689A664